MRCKFNLVMILLALLSWSVPVHAGQKRALSEHDLLELLAGGVYDTRIAELVRDRGITFVPTAADLASLRRAGADVAVLQAVEGARHITAQVPERVGKPPPPQVRPPPIPNAVESTPRNILNVRPAPSVVPQTPPARTPNLQTSKMPAPALTGATIPVGTTITIHNWQQ